MSIEATKEGVKFACIGDIGSGSVTVRPHTNVDDPKKNVEIQLTEPVLLTFSLKYLVNFCKASALSESVKLCLSNEVPLLVEYGLSGSSYLRYYLAPKVEKKFFSFIFLANPPFPPFLPSLFRFFSIASTFFPPSLFPHFPPIFPSFSFSPFFPLLFFPASLQCRNEKVTFY